MNTNDIIREFDEKFDHFNDDKETGKRICDCICDKEYDLEDVKDFLLHALQQQKKEILDCLPEENNYIEMVKFDPKKCELFVDGFNDCRDTFLKNLKNKQ